MEELLWLKSAHCGHRGKCVEVAFAVDGKAVYMRDSKDTSGPVLVFTRNEWDAFVGGAKDGEFDL